MEHRFRRSPARTLARVSLALAGLLSLLGMQEANAEVITPAQKVIVKFKDQALHDAEARVGREGFTADFLQNLGRRAGVGMLRERTIATGGDVIRLDEHLSARRLAALLAAMKADPRVEYAEEDRLMHTLLTPNDTYYTNQWDLYESTAGIDVPTAWDKANGSGVVVAIIDTGYRPHADLVNNIVGGYDFIADTSVSNDGNGRDSDASDPGDWTTAGQCGSGSSATSSSWHGTHVAGTVGAVTNNGSGVAGVAYGAQIVPVRVLGTCGGYTSDIADGIVWASGGSVSGVPTNTHPAKVLSLSLGGSGACDSTTQAAVNGARSRGATVVVAAGNSNADSANFSPASCTGVIAVAAVNRSGGKAYYSNYGSVVAVAAPGGDTRSSSSNGILSTLNTGTTTPGSDTYGYYQGTSQATPHVSGVAALLYAIKPTITPDEVRTALTSTARAFPATCSQCGAGIIDAAAAINYVQNGGSGGGGGSCAAGYTTYTGTLSGTGSSLYAPSTSGRIPSTSGTLSARLSGPSSADFDLYLQRKTLSGTSWSSVASSTSSTSTESIDYSGTTSYYYRWRVYSYSGSGSFTLCSKIP